MVELKFYSFMPNETKDTPIEKSKIKNFAWYSKCLANYYETNTKIHTSRCPGILSVCNEGWIQRAYQDFAIMTNGDGISFSSQVRIAQESSKYGRLISGYISAHEKSQLFEFNEFKRNTLSTIVKIQSPWVVDIPEGYMLLTIPIPYNDSNEFTACIGILKGVNSLNPQLFWHVLNGRVVIKKGTPLCQYLLIKEEKVDFSVNDINEDIITKLVQNQN